MHQKTLKTSNQFDKHQTAAQHTLKLKAARSLTRLLVLGATTFLPLSYAQMASAQDSTPYSFGEMLAPGGITLPLGIIAQAEVFTTGTASGATTNNHGRTGLANPANIGGILNSTEASDAGFDAPNRILGITEQATRINGLNSTLFDNGYTNDYNDALGFRVFFSSPIPVDYFYGLDLDGTEWKSSFAFDQNGLLIEPTHILDGVTELMTVTEDVSASWNAALPAGLNVNPTMTISQRPAGLSGTVGPGDHPNQIIFDYGNASISEIYFLFGQGTTSTNTSGQRNSALSAMFLAVPEFDVSKGAAVGALQSDGTADITYTVTVENSGSADFTQVSVQDILTFPATIVSPPTIVTQASDPASIALVANSAWTGAAPNENLLTATPNALAAGDSFQVAFTVNVNVSETAVSNIATVSGEPDGFSGSFASDGSDPSTDADGNPDTTQNVPGGPEIATIINLPTPTPSLSITKVANSEGPHSVGDVVTYTYTVMNDGDVNVRNTAISDTHNGSDPAPTPGNETLLTDTGTQGDSTDAAVDGTWDILAPGDSVTFTGTYTITATDVVNLQ